MSLRRCGLTLTLLASVSSLFSSGLEAGGQSRCSVTGAMYLADGSQFLNFSKARRFLVGSPKAACTAAREGLKEGLSLTSDQAGLRLCLVKDGDAQPCVRAVARLRQGVDANRVLSLVAGQSAQAVRLETSAHLYVRPKAGL